MQVKNASALQASLSSWHWSGTQLSHPSVKNGQERKAAVLRAASSASLVWYCGNVFKQAWEDLASCPSGLCKEKEKVMNELGIIKLFHCFNKYFSELVIYSAR